MESVKEIARRVTLEIRAAAEAKRKPNIIVPRKALKNVKRELARQAHESAGYVAKTPVALELASTVRAQLAELKHAGKSVDGTVAQRVADMLTDAARKARNRRRRSR